jgi:hypothetical protein
LKKIAVGIMTVCFLFCLPAMLPAEKTVEIKFKVVEKLNDQKKMAKVIDMDEQYVCVVQKEDLIKWKCDCPFALVFAEEAFIENVPDQPKVKERKAKEFAILNHAYKYTLVAFSGEDVVTLDPVIIIIPPRK